MSVTFLGTGTSQGVPVIGCECDTCLSQNAKDKRLRSSVLVQVNGTNVLIDAGPDLRQQMLRQNVRHLAAILLTHEHNDHTIGLDDIRPFNFMQGGDMPLYALQRVIDDIKVKFAYVFAENPYPGSPRMVCHSIKEGDIFPVQELFYVEAIHVLHGNLPILGFRFGQFAYITDASTLDVSTINQLKGVDTLVLNALRYRKHNTHFNFDEAVSVAALIGARQTYFTHLSHEMGYYDDLLEKLPPSILPAYDGLKISWK
jgi:phosphoribosyl 1,2-cyclic phosphate phosphodiesterase